MVADELLTAVPATPEAPILAPLADAEAAVSTDPVEASEVTTEDGAPTAEGAERKRRRRGRRGGRNRGDRREAGAEGANGEEADESTEAQDDAGDLAARRRQHARDADGERGLQPEGMHRRRRQERADEHADAHHAAERRQRPGAVERRHGLRQIALPRQVVDGLGHAHAQGVLHRDLRPSNVLVGENGICKVADFGTSRFLEIAAHGTTVIDSAAATTPSVGGNVVTISLSGYITSPAGNLRISVRDATNTTSNIKFNYTGNSKDSTITAIRIG